MARIQIVVVLSFFAIFGIISAKTGFGPGDQEWGYVDVREGAHMFYWLYKTTANVSNYTDRPLGLWLQGGPSHSSTGIGNFRQIGPLDLDGKQRRSTWVKDMNVLFIDNPVGTGFSYVDDKKLLVSNNSQIASDLLVFIKSFYERHPEFVKVPLHVFGQSYGAKMAVDFALALYNATQRNEIKCDLTSVTLSSPFISPVDVVLSWAPLLFAISAVDRDGQNNIQLSAEKVVEFVQKEDWAKTAEQYGKTTTIMKEETYGIDAYNFLKPQVFIKSTSSLVQTYNTRRSLHHLNTLFDDAEEDKLEKLMQGPVKCALGIPSNVSWGSQSEETYDTIYSGDFMKPVNQSVNDLLTKTNVKVNVISGQLDVVCSVSGTVKWIDKLRWPHHDEYERAERKSIYISNVLEGYEKSGGNLNMYWVLRAGHKTSVENPIAVSHIVKKITNISQRHGKKIKIN